MGREKLFVAVPFQTGALVKQILENERLSRANAVFLPTKKIATIEELLRARFSEKDHELILKMVEDVYYNGEVPVATQTLTYFDHKVPDFASFPVSIRNGAVGYWGGPNDFYHGMYTGNLYPFIPQVTPPYKQ